MCRRWTRTSVNFNPNIKYFTSSTIQRQNVKVMPLQFLHVTWSSLCHMGSASWIKWSHGGAKGHQRSIKFKMLTNVFINPLADHLLVCSNKKSTMYFSLDQSWPNGCIVGRTDVTMVRILLSLFSQRLEVGLIQEHFQAFQTTFMVFILSTLVSWMR